MFINYLLTSLITQYNDIKPSSVDIIGINDNIAIQIITSV